MKILTLIAIIALPFLALGQTTEPQQSQDQTKETQTTAPTKTKKMHSTMEQNKPEIRSETGTSVRGQTNVKSHAPDVNRHETGVRSGTSTSTGTSQTNVGGTTQTTTVNKQELKSRHSEVFSLGRHPKEFFIQRYGANHVRLIGNEYFVFLDGCWVAVDVDGFVYSQRMICAGDPDFIAVD